VTTEGPSPARSGEPRAGSSLDGELRRRLAALRAGGLERSLALPEGVDFASNDYLGLAADPVALDAIAARVRAALDAGEMPFAPASRLLRGTTPAHLRLEERLASFKGAEAALLFPSGYQANVGLLTALLSPGDRAISDRHNHASIIDGLRLAGCRKVVVPHLDLDALGAALAEEHHGGRTVVIVESLYGMDGDLAPLPEIAALCRRSGADLVVDEAHATGLFGARGSGWVEACGVEGDVAAVVTTFGKALGAAGACVTGSRPLVDFLVNTCRPFVFSTALPPLVSWAVEAGLDLVAGEPWRRARALALAARLRGRLATQRLEILGGEGPVVPLVLGDNERAVRVAAAVRSRGFDVRAVRPPTVPPGTARLRLSVHADRTEAEVDALATAVGEAMAAEVAVPARDAR
jgi:8-amino-7-oxononanoate synthase